MIYVLGCLGMLLHGARQGLEQLSTDLAPKTSKTGDIMEIIMTLVCAPRTVCAIIAEYARDVSTPWVSDEQAMHITESRTSTSLDNTSGMYA